MSLFVERLKEAMNSKGVRQIDIAKKTGIDRSKISCYIHGRYLPNAEAMSKIAMALGVTPEYLLGKDSSQQVIVPILGKVAAGVPIYADTNIIGYTVADEEGVFALLVKGDSMSPRIMDGDMVLVRKQDTAEDGDLIIAVIGDEATCKVFHRTAWGVTLVPFNTAHSPITFVGGETETLHILGKVIESRHKWL